MADNGALTPFPQQGTLDWTTLARINFSASIAVLSRLAGAGVEPLTVAFGQAMGTRIPIGSHGEKALAEAMGSLRAFSSFGDLVWFGVGVRHVLRDIVQTSEGMSLVALAAALADAFSIKDSALVLYEMSKILRAPTELSPSFTQWEALVRTSSCLLASTNFGLTVEKLLDLGGFKGYANRGPGHPHDLAKTILALGQVCRGSLDRVDVQGGAACCGIAAYAIFILGVRVEVAANGVVVFKNFDGQYADAQLRVDLTTTDAATAAAQKGSAVRHIGSSFVVRDGFEFIKQAFNAERPYEFSPVGGTVPWETAFHDTFGDDADELLRLEHPRSQAVSSKHTVVGLTDDDSDSNQREFSRPFADLLRAGIEVYVTHTAEACFCDSPSGYLHYVADKLPELRPFANSLKFDQYSEPNELLSRYNKASAAVKLQCRCIQCDGFSISSGSRGQLSRSFCLSALADTILVMTYVIARSKFDSDLRVRRLGLLRLFTDVEDNLFHLGERYYKLKFAELVDNIKILVRHLTRESLVKMRLLFSLYATLFGGNPILATFHTKDPSAASNGTIYCFVDTVSELSRRYGKASRVHVGAGAIEYRSRAYLWVFDKAMTPGFGGGEYLAHISPYNSPPSLAQSNGPSSSSSTSDAAAATASTASDTNNASDGDRLAQLLGMDNSSPSLRVEALVEDMAGLVFYYRVTSDRGKRFISPASFVDCLLPTALLSAQITAGYLPWLQWRPRLSKMIFGVADSEGRVANMPGILDVADDAVVTADASSLPSCSCPDATSSAAAASALPIEGRLVFHPHAGNLLGTCVALSWRPQQSVVIENEAKLDTYLGWYADEADRLRQQGKDAAVRFVIIA